MMKLKVLAVAALVAALVATPAAAQGFKAGGCNTATVNVTVTTTTEAVAVSSPVVQLPFDTGEIFVFGWAQLTTGTNTTGVTPMIRQGTAITGTALTEANIEGVKITAGGTEPFYAIGIEQRTASNVQYSFTLKQTAASADGSILQAGICVLAR